MANRKYDYSDEAPRPAEAGKTPEVTAEEARRQRLEQRNDALANEFRKLKPEIADAHRKLRGYGNHADPCFRYSPDGTWTG